MAGGVPRILMSRRLSRGLVPVRLVGDGVGKEEAPVAAET
jgi:hypothetical protein